MTGDNVATVVDEVDGFMRLTRRFRHCEGDECALPIDDLDMHLLDKFHHLSDMAKIRVITGHCSLCVNNKPAKDTEALTELKEIEGSSSKELIKLRTSLVKFSIGAVVILTLVMTVYMAVAKDMPNSSFIGIIDMLFKVLKVIIGI